jgi:hypothetical protein
LEVNELFSGWVDHPPTNILVKAIVEGLGGGRKAQIDHETMDIPPDASAAMQRSALAGIASKAGPTLPVMRGRDLGLPTAQPVFDIDEMKRRNAEIMNRRRSLV